MILRVLCSAIASDVKLITYMGNHRTDWFTNSPFPIFCKVWEVVILRNKLLYSSSQSGKVQKKRYKDALEDVLKVKKATLT